MEAINMWGYACFGIFSHNSFKIQKAAKLECVAIYTYGSICDGAVQLLDSTQTYNISRSALRSPMATKTTWDINDQCEVRNTNDNEWYPGKIISEILTDNYLDVEHYSWAHYSINKQCVQKHNSVIFRYPEYILNNCPGAAIQPRRVSQDMLEGLFGTIREMGSDSSTQTL
ncbi:hypothetical protein C2G38_2033159 [Gigaspora rosea]|uniref:Uncharacterized protein n=1 Tax=Gigaspora rosea TaxID=44941 RepID=A0A397VKD5_9GLOM|nr:hypothetical protein C2G38_2033159 [Gigaspora rosea]